jgi:lysophospholipase L1-like esterase
MDDTLSEYSALHNYLAPTLQGILVRFGVLDTKFSKNYEAKVDQRIRLTRKLVGELSSEAEKNDAKLVIVPIPPREIARQNGETSRLVGNKTYWKRQKQMLDLVANKRSNTEVLSIQPEITDRINNGNKQYGIRNGHFNEQGYKTMAELIQKRQFDQQISDEKLEKSYGRNSKNCPV